MNSITTFKSSDDKLFDNEKEHLNHEKFHKKFHKNKGVNNGK